MTADSVSSSSSFHRELTIIAILVLVGSVIVTCFIAFQAINLKSTSDDLQRQVYGAHFGVHTSSSSSPSDASAASAAGVIRSYGLLMHARRSQLLNREFPDARFVGEELRSCGASGRMEMVRVEYARPRWLLFQKARSSNRLIEDIDGGTTTHMVVDGIPCRARLPTTAESDEIHAVAPEVQPRRTDVFDGAGSKIASHAVLVVPASDANIIESGLRRTCVGDAPSMYAFRQERRDGESWKETMDRWAAREEAMSNVSTLMNVWGYSVI